MLLNVGFNKEVAEESALYWTKEEGNLASLIAKADNLDVGIIDSLGAKAKNRILTSYSWEYICDKYLSTFLNK